MKSAGRSHHTLPFPAYYLPPPPTPTTTTTTTFPTGADLLPCYCHYHLPSYLYYLRTCCGCTAPLLARYHLPLAAPACRRATARCCMRAAYLCCHLPCARVRVLRAAPVRCTYRAQHIYRDNKFCGCLAARPLPATTFTARTPPRLRLTRHAPARTAYGAHTLASLPALTTCRTLVRTRRLLWARA